MASVKKLQKELVKLDEEQLKEVLGFLTEDEQEEVKVAEVKKEEEKVVEKVEVKEEPKKEVSTQNITLSKEDLQSLLDGILGKYVTKEEIKEVETKVEKATKKAQPFGVEQKNEKIEVTEKVDLNTYLEKLNSQYL